MIATITQALQRGDVSAALSAAQDFVVSDSQNPQAHHWLGICLQRNGDIAGARAAIDQAINMAPDRADFQISRATLALGQNDYAAAEKGMKDAVDLDPNQLQAYVTLAHIALARGENEEAVKQLKLAQRINEDHPQVLLLQGHVAQYSGQADVALKCFTAAAEMEPRNPLAQVSLGMAYGSRGMWPFAEQALKNAMALEPLNPGVMRGLVRSQLAQGKPQEAIDALGRWLINKPDDLAARMMRAQVRMQIGQLDEALEDLMMVHAATPGNPQVLSPLVNVLMAMRRQAEALEVTENAVQLNSSNDTLWATRLSLAGNDAAAMLVVLQRWLTAMPESAKAHETMAQMHENSGAVEAAELSADKALSIRPDLPQAQFIKLRAEIRNAPDQALKRLEMLQRAANNPDAQRMVLIWRGLTYDKLMQFDKAAESFREMVKHVSNQPPLPAHFPGEPASDRAEIAGTLIWAPTGTRIENVLRSLAGPLNERLLVDRNLPQARTDGFGHLRGLPGTPQAGTAESWQSSIQQKGLDPAVVIDWVPHFDAYMASELSGLRTVAVMSDPRDALINWMVYGSAQAYGFHPDINVSAEWLAITCEMFADELEKNPSKVGLVKIDDLPAQAVSVAEALRTALELEEMPEISMLGLGMPTYGGIDNQFPGGHWRHYRASFKAAFDRLTPVAVRLGYSES